MMKNQEIVTHRLWGDDAYDGRGGWLTPEQVEQRRKSEAKAERAIFSIANRIRCAVFAFKNPDQIY